MVPELVETQPRSRRMNWVHGKQVEQAGAPNLAAVLTWFVPGAGHLYLGRPLVALGAFVIVQGLYFVGLRLTEGMAFEFLQPDLRGGPYVVALSPEAGNLGALVWHIRQYGFGPGFPREWPSHIHLGTWLTAVSGFANACVMLMAHTEARLPKREAARALRPTLMVFAGWLVPGLGHFLQKRRLRAVVVFTLLVGLVVLGSLLAQGSNLDRERHYYYWGGQFLAGLLAMVLELVHGHARVTGEIPYAEAGLMIGCVGGLLNVLALIDVYGFDENRLLANASAARVAEPLAADAAS